MRLSSIAVGLALALLLGVPLALAPRRGEAMPEDARVVVVFTPHNEQIRREFGDAFARWHERVHGEPARVVWSTPGGTGEIRKMLEAAYLADLRRGAEVGGQGDVLFGGGSFEFIRLSRPLSIETPDGRRTTTVLAPVALDPAFLAEVYGPPIEGAPPTVGDIPLHAADGSWFGAALSGFGIVWNRDLYRELELPDPQRWSDLATPRLLGRIALVNPAQSGSVASAYEAILQRRGWTEGWRILRRMAANARTFAATAPRAPTDVSLGDAAAGVCIDFFGRYQAQAVRDGGGGDRLGYVDPAGETTIDPDPVAMLRGAPHPELARRFIEFTLSPEGQALWQFRSRDESGAGDGLGPERYELRRMPIRRDLYATHRDRFVDDADPFAIATRVPEPNPRMRDFVAPIFTAFAVDVRSELVAAWRAIVEHPAYPRALDGDELAVVGAEDVDHPQLRRMIEAFDAMPIVRGPGGRGYDLADPASLATVSDGWLRGGWREEGLWPADAAPAEALRSEMTAFFRARYREVLAIAAEGDGA